MPLPINAFRTPGTAVMRLYSSSRALCECSMLGQRDGKRQEGRLQRAQREASSPRRPYILAVGAPTSEIIPLKCGMAVRRSTSATIDSGLRLRINFP